MRAGVFPGRVRALCDESGVDQRDPGDAPCQPFQHPGDRRIALTIAALVTAAWLALLATVAHGVAGADDNPAPVTCHGATVTSVDPAGYPVIKCEPFPTTPDTTVEPHIIPTTITTQPAPTTTTTDPEDRYQLGTGTGPDEPTTTTTVVVVRPQRQALPETS